MPFFEGEMGDCKNVSQMKAYYNAARSFDEFFPKEKSMPNCQTYNYIPHGYYTDYTYEKLDDPSESEIVVVFSSFFSHVSWIMYW